jgi:hypothetical protein
MKWYELIRLDEKKRVYTTRILLQGMPALEVVCTMDGIEEPFEMNTENFADLAFSDRTLDEFVDWVVAIVESHLKNPCV